MKYTFKGTSSPKKRNEPPSPFEGLRFVVWCLIGSCVTAIILSFFEGVFKL